jgi:PilZ domain
MNSTDKERRKEARHALKTDATIQVVRSGEAIAATTHDISASGVLLVLENGSDLKVGDEVMCEVRIPNSEKDESTWAKGKLVRASGSQAAFSLKSGALDRTLCQPCPCCKGSGMVTSITTMCYDILTKARSVASELDSAEITLLVHPDIANLLKTREAALVKELEHLIRKSVIIQDREALHWEQYDIR